MYIYIYIHGTKDEVQQRHALGCSTIGAHHISLGPEGSDFPRHPVADRNGSGPEPLGEEVTGHAIAPAALLGEPKAESSTLN